MSLIIGGTTIPVAKDGFEEQAPLHVGGDYAEAADGSPIDQSRGIKRRYRVTTTHLKPADYALIRARLDTRGAQLVSGTLPEIASAATQVLGSRILEDAADIRRAIIFRLLES